MAVALVYAFFRYQIFTAKAVDATGTDEMFSTIRGDHHMEGSRGGPGRSFEVNQPSIRGESQFIELGDDTAHITVKTIMAANQQCRMAIIESPPAKARRVGNRQLRSLLRFQ